MKEYLEKLKNYTADSISKEILNRLKKSEEISKEKGFAHYLFLRLWLEKFENDDDFENGVIALKKIYEFIKTKIDKSDFGLSNTEKEALLLLSKLSKYDIPKELGQSDPKSIQKIKSKCLILKDIIDDVNEQLEIGRYSDDIKINKEGFIK